MLVHVFVDCVTGFTMAIKGMQRAYNVFFVNSFTASNRFMIVVSNPPTHPKLLPPSTPPPLRHRMQTLLALEPLKKHSKRILT